MSVPALNTLARAITHTLDVTTSTPYLREVTRPNGVKFWQPTEQLIQTLQTPWQTHQLFSLELNGLKPETMDERLNLKSTLIGFHQELTAPFADAVSGNKVIKTTKINGINSVSSPHQDAETALFESGYLQIPVLSLLVEPTNTTHYRQFVARPNAAIQNVPLPQRMVDDLKALDPENFLVFPPDRGNVATIRQLNDTQFLHGVLRGQRLIDPPYRQLHAIEVHTP
jgi:hypothetical protein